jgi:PAS domain S-box-containing protein
MSIEAQEPSLEVQQLRARVVELEASQRQQQEIVDELRRRTADSETRFRNVFEYSNDTILLLDLDRNEILDVSARGCRVFGYTHQELQGLPISAIFPSDMARLQAFALSVVEDGFGWIDEVGCQTRTGEAFPAEVSASEVPLSTERTCILVLLRDVTERNAVDAQIRASLLEKDVLLREIHHRVENNLQVVTSLFDLQASRIQNADMQAMLRECRNRVRSMSAIHESLYRAHDLSRVDFRRYVT